MKGEKKISFHLCDSNEVIYEDHIVKMTTGSQSSFGCRHHVLFGKQIDTLAVKFILLISHNIMLFPKRLPLVSSWENNGKLLTLHPNSLTEQGHGGSLIHLRGKMRKRKSNIKQLTELGFNFCLISMVWVISSKVVSSFQQATISYEIIRNQSILQSGISSNITSDFPLSQTLDKIFYWCTLSRCKNTKDRIKNAIIYSFQLATIPSKVISSIQPATISNEIEKGKIDVTKRQFTGLQIVHECQFSLLFILHDLLQPTE